MTHLAPAKPWFIEEPTAPDDAVGHAKIRKALKPMGIKVATGEHTHNRMAFKQFFELEAYDVCQMDAVRVGGFNEVLTILLMAKKYGVPVCPHSGAVGLMNYHVHVSLIDFVCVTGEMEHNVLEYVDHHFVHDPFIHPVGPVNARGRYPVPLDPEVGASIAIFDKTIEKFSHPHGSYWAAHLRGEDTQQALDA
ncbi:hypothetical protein L486_05320 [Kwoniella mangroviensis CBS 10435]|uniref:Enolase C-terminal domain-containing protein n=2 Tax=Kwoniella mangrovensis TaxID=463800 RepID=A0A1B9IQL8_9TREE|nr:hypothetical protein L486_05320 [Kwoniella mangroviensis CBS 10435]